MRPSANVGRPCFISSGQPAVASVWNGPDEMQLTRTVGPNAFASDSVMLLSPAFAAAYGANEGSGRSAPDDEMLMIEPRPAWTIRVPTSVASRNGPRRFRFSTLSHICSFTSATLGYVGDFPALLIKTSTRPNR